MGFPDPEDTDKGKEKKTKEDSQRKKKKKKEKKQKKIKEEKGKSEQEVEGSAIKNPLQQHRHKHQEQPPPVTPPPQGSHPFEVDDSDHCETPLRAYQDIAFLLDHLLMPTRNTINDKNGAKHNQKRPRSSLRIYDPYYCDGGVKTKLASLGFTNVINENRDFYKDIATKQVPDYDVLVTNPPYSGEHMEKLLDFCVATNKPSFLLLPHFVYTKDYYSRALSPLRNIAQRFFCFLVPSMRYSYIPPAWVQHKTGSKALARGKDQTAPFPSFWYACHLQKTTITKEWLRNTFGPSGSFKSKHSASGLRYAEVPSDIPRDFKGEFDPTKKRPNPRARKRMRMAAAAAAANGGQTPLQQSSKEKQPPRQRQRDPKKKKKRRY